MSTQKRTQALQAADYKPDALRHRLVALVGPNASGKTSFAVKLAKKFNGEIISADSRQVYRGMDIGTGKATKQEQRQARHYLLDIASPRHEYNVSHFKRDARRVIKSIHRLGKLPFLVGGTGFWIQAVVDNVDFPPVRPNKLLRRRLVKLTTKKLFNFLKKIDPGRAQNIDRDNPYRLIRAIEIIKATKRPIAPLDGKPLYDTLILGLNPPRKKLYKIIDRRLTKRLRQGLVAEVRLLHSRGVSWPRLYNVGLEYRYVSLYLQGKLTRQQMIEQLQTAIHHYAKRQMTWFRRDKRIHWIKNQKQAEKLITQFIKL